MVRGHGDVTLASLPASQPASQPACRGAALLPTLATRLLLDIRATAAATTTLQYLRHHEDSLTSTIQYPPPHAATAVLTIAA
ncbi:hypothetical protein E2C01_014724 [Portunus trituberculatus]|uniref:Uncharacterized protein n=1 Tax=Portunus trituberculatus TaxID=210409 RepID=A0A5B7DJV7_PORTR|nr:hypothetical protein [Portunus trituberculatus]